MPQSLLSSAPPRRAAGKFPPAQALTLQKAALASGSPAMALVVRSALAQALSAKEYRTTGSPVARVHSAIATLGRVAARSVRASLHFFASRHVPYRLGRPRYRRWSETAQPGLAKSRFPPPSRAALLRIERPADSIPELLPLASRRSQRVAPRPQVLVVVETSRRTETTAPPVPVPGRARRVVPGATPAPARCAATPAAPDQVL